MIIPEATPRPIRRRLGKALRHRRRLRNGVIQLSYVLAALVLGVTLPSIDAGPTMSNARASQMLFTTGAGVVTFIGVVYSLLFLVVQFGTTTFTPRLNLFRDSAIVAHGFAFFTAVVVFCFTAALTHSEAEKVTIFVPVFLVFLLMATLAMFRQIQATAFRSIQLAAVLEQVKERGREVIDGVYPEPFDEANTRSGARLTQTGTASELRWTGEAGVLQALDVLEVVHIATQADLVFEWCAPIGDTIFHDDLMARMYAEGPVAEATTDRALRALSVGPERTFEQDPRLVFRVLSDIALRALSPAISDPTTVTQALSASESLLRELMRRDLDIGDVTDAAGALRLRFTPPTWADYVELATEEVILQATSSVQVTRHLEQMLTRLLKLGTENHRPPLAAAYASLQTVIGPPTVVADRTSTGSQGLRP